MKISLKAGQCVLFVRVGQVGEAWIFDHDGLEANFLGKMENVPQDPMRVTNGVAMSFMEAETAKYSLRAEQFGPKFLIYE